MIDGETEEIFRLSDVSAKNAFKSYFKNDSIWNKNQLLLNQAQLRRARTITNISIGKERLYIAAQYIYLILSDDKKDTIEDRFSVVHIVNNDGVLIKTIPVSYSLDAPETRLGMDIVYNRIKKDTVLYNRVSSSFWTDKDEKYFFFGVRGQPSKRVKAYKKYFIGRYQLNEENDEFVFVDYLPHTLGEQYNKIGYNLSNSNVSWDKRYFANYLEDNVYITDDWGKKIKLDIFSDNKPVISAFGLKNYIVALNMNKTTAYVLCGLNDKFQYVKKNIETNEIQAKEVDMLINPQSLDP